jgi:MarR family transcriptional regulator, organic hydroperoxide resistance regulator
VPSESGIRTPWDVPRFRNWIAVAKVNLLVEKMLSGGLAELGLKLPHYDILLNVYRYPDLTQQELANRLLVGRSNLSMVLPELEKRGLLLRAQGKDDKRIRRLQLTEVGRALTEKALAIQVSVIERVTQALDTEECEQLGDYMRRIGAHLTAGQKRGTVP